jgi:integral membrane sensor domain MASE1
MAKNTVTRIYRITSNGMSLAHFLWWVGFVVGIMGLLAFGIVVRDIVPYIMPSSQWGEIMAMFLTLWLCTFLALRIKDDPRFKAIHVKRHYDDIH